MTAAATLVGEVAKNSREMIRVSLDQFKGHDVVGLRVWAQGDDGPIPTKTGLTIRVALLPALVRLVVAAEAEARAKGLLPTE